MHAIWILVLQYLSAPIWCVGIIYGDECWTRPVAIVWAMMTWTCPCHTVQEHCEAIVLLLTNQELDRQERKLGAEHVAGSWKKLVQSYKGRLRREGCRERAFGPECEIDPIERALIQSCKPGSRPRRREDQKC